MIQVKWVHSYQIGIAKASDEDVAMVELSSLTEVGEALRLALDYYRSKGSQKYNPYEVEQRLEKTIAQLEVRS